MADAGSPLPSHYASAIRVLLRYAIVAAFAGLLVGIFYREATRSLDFASAGPGLHLEATLQLALVHGHVFVTAVLIPIALAGALLLARRAGGAEVGAGFIRWLTRGYLPFTAVTVALLLLKGYHVLRRVRAGERDLDAMAQHFFLGDGLLRMGVYGVAHGGMGVCLAVFLVGLWRSLRARA